MKWPYLFSFYAAVAFICAGYALAQGKGIAVMGGLALGCIAINMVRETARKEPKS